MSRVLVNGTFDIIHRGHLEMLAFAYNLSKDPNGYSKVRVLIDSDRRVKELKGPYRPINNQDDRSHMLASLYSVTGSVQIFDTDEELASLIKDYAPDFMVKGSDWKGKLIIGSEYCKSIVYYDIIEGYSTTKAIKDIVDRGCL